MTRRQASMAAGHAMLHAEPHCVPESLGCQPPLHHEDCPSLRHRVLEDMRRTQRALPTRTPGCEVVRLSRLELEALVELCGLDMPVPRGTGSARRKLQAALKRSRSRG